MQSTFVLVLSLAFAGAAAEKMDPMGKVFEMLDELKAQIVKEGEAAQKAYHEFFEWCDDTCNEKRNEITTATRKKEELESLITERTSDADAAGAKIEELAASIAKDGAELKDATLIREKEAAEFVVNEADLVETIDTITRAVGIIEKEMAKNPAAFAQVDTSNVNKMVTALKAIIGAASFNVNDKQRLLALVQAKHGSDADDEDDDALTEAPAAAVYKTHTGGIFDLLEDLKEEAEEQLASLRKVETTSAHNFGMLKQSLEDSIAADTKAKDEETAVQAAAEEEVATAEGELAMTVKALKGAEAALAEAHSDCIQTAADHEASVTARTEELTVLEQAQKILKESTGGAVSQTYSLVQMRSTMRTREDLMHSEVVAIVKKLAKTHHSAALAQLASRINAVVRFSMKSGADPFGKVKGLIEGLIKKLEAEGAAEATEKAYCDEQMSKTEAKKAEVEEDVEKLTTKIDKSSAKSAALKEEVKDLQAELAAIAKSQMEMDQIRSETHADYVTAKAELEAGLAGVRKALEVLRDYYGGSSASLLQGGANMASLMQQPAKPKDFKKAEGAGGSIIDILEVCESDFASGLAKEEMEESDAETEYQKMTQENKLAVTAKKQDVKYKTQEFTGLDKAISDLESDLATENQELAAVNEYYEKVKDRCIAVPESYEERAAKREAEIKGLKTALSVLENETAFMQRRGRGRRSHHLRHQ